MAKKEFKIGEEFQCGLIRLKCAKSNEGCRDCFFAILDCTDMIYMLGECKADKREDKTDVNFVEVEE